MERRIAAGSFREDLYYRLSVFPIETPALRDRMDDLPELIRHLASRTAQHGRPLVRLTPAAIQALKHHDWPGNVRELGNLVERLAITRPDAVIDVQHLPARYRTHEYHCLDEAAAGTAEGDSATALPPGGLDLKNYLASIETEMIRQALGETDGVVARAARLLQMRRTTLVEKMRKYQMRAGDRACNA